MSDMKKIKVNAQRTCFYEFTMQVPVDANYDEISVLVSEEMNTENCESELDIDWEDFQNVVVDIVLPINKENPFGIVEGSAILVSRELNSSGLYDVYYEGNLYNASNLQNFEDRLLVAAGRMRDKAPTVARSCMKPGDIAKTFTKAGEYDLNKLKAAITDQASLDEWCCVA